MISSSSKLIDLGSGTGEIVLTAAYVFELKAVGIEFSSNLIAISKDITQQLEEFKSTKFEVDFIEGDYSIPDIIDIKEFDIIFNFLSGDISDVLQRASSNSLFLSYLAENNKKDLFGKSTIRKIVRRIPFGRSQFGLKYQLSTDLASKFQSWKYLICVPETQIHVWQKD